MSLPETISMPQLLFLLLVFAASLPLLAARQKDPSDQDAAIASHLRSAQQLLAEQKPHDAVLEYQAVLAIRPDSLEAQANLGIVLFFQNDCARAAGHLDRALQMQPGLAKIQALLGVCQKREGKLEAAKQNLEAALPLVTEPKISLMIENNLTALYYAEGDLQLAGRSAESLLQMDPHNPEVLYMVYRIHTDIADRARNALATIAPDSPRMHQMMAEHFVNEGDVESAISQYERALSGDPKLPDVRYELAEAVIQESTSPASLQRATDLLKASLEENPGNAGAEAKLGDIAMIEGDVNAAKDYFSRALTMRDDEPDALEGMANIATRQGNDEEALKYLIRASRENPLDDKLHYRLSLLYRRLNRTQDANRELDLFMKTRNLRKKTALVEQRVTSP